MFGISNSGLAQVSAIFNAGGRVPPRGLVEDRGWKECGGASSIENSGDLIPNIPLIFPIVTLHRIEQPFGVVPDAVLEDDFDVFDIRDASGRITLHHHEVRVLPRRN
jgi:hypothetical protein